MVQTMNKLKPPPWISSSTQYKVAMVHTRIPNTTTTIIPLPSIAKTSTLMASSTIRIKQSR